MPKVQYVTINDRQVGQRIDNFLLKQLKKVPRSHIYQLLRKGEIRVNKKRVKPLYRLQVEDVVRIAPVVVPERQTTTLRRDQLQWLEQAILYENPGLVVVNKPSGIAVHGGSGVHCGVIDMLRQLRPQSTFLELVHRLDKGTSGCLLIAKKRRVLLALQTQWRERQVKKHYLAIVAGHWPQALNKVEVPLQRLTRASGERIVKVSDQGKYAKTCFEVVQELVNATLVRAFLHTGRTHQIRVHTQYAKHPILGDEKYGMVIHNPIVDVKSLCLHAEQLQFIDPLTDEQLSVKAQYPVHFGQILKKLQL